MNEHIFGRSVGTCLNSVDMALPFLLFAVSAAVQGMSATDLRSQAHRHRGSPRVFAVGHGGPDSYSCLFLLQQVWHGEAPLSQPHKPFLVTPIPHSQLYFLQFTPQPDGDQQDRLGKWKRVVGSVPVFPTG